MEAKKTRKPRKPKPLPQLEIVTMRPSQIEQAYGIKRGTLHNMFADGLACVRRKGRQGRPGTVLVYKADLDAYLAARRECQGGE